MCLLLNGKIYTGRDAAHKRMVDMLNKGEKLPVDFTDKIIYYVGPVDPVRDEVVGPAGPPPPPAWTDSPARCWSKPAFWHDRQIRARRSRLPGHCRQQSRVSDGRGQLLLYLVAEAITRSREWWPSPIGHGSDFRIRSERHARHRGRRQQRLIGAPVAPKQWQAKIGIIPVES